MKQQMQTGNTTVPSESAAWNKSETVSFIFATVHVRPKETSESPYEETETSGEKKENALMLEFNTREGPESLFDNPD